MLSLRLLLPRIELLLAYQRLLLPQGMPHILQHLQHPNTLVRKLLEPKSDVMPPSGNFDSIKNLGTTAKSVSDQLESAALIPFDRSALSNGRLWPSAASGCDSTSDITPASPHFSLKCAGRHAAQLLLHKSRHGQFCLGISYGMVEVRLLIVLPESERCHIGVPKST